MATTTVTPCAQSSSLPLNPYLGVLYSFGMLLGREDFQVEQGHPLGKSRVHNAWMHGPGVVWGFEVRVDLEPREVRVLPGLALDGVGRELHLDQDSCLDVAAWLEEHRNDPALAIRTDPQRPGVEMFDAHVVVRYLACQSRPVPSLSEPCDGSGASGVAYSRIVETVALELRAGLAPAPAASPFHRVRLLFQLDAPRTNGGGAVTAEDQAVLDAAQAVAELPPGEQPAALVTVMHRFAVLDGLALKPPVPADASAFSLFPELDPGAVVLANVADLALGRDGDRIVLSGGTVNPLVRPQHLPTRTIQDLVGGAAASGQAAIAQATITNTAVSLRFTAALAPATVLPAAFEVSQFTGAAWSAVTISTATYDAASRTVRLDLGSALGAAATVRILVRMASMPALLGAGGAPLAARPQDIVITRKRS